MTGVLDVLKAGENTLSHSNMTLTKLPRSMLVRGGADDNSPCAEEPCEGERLMHGSEVAAGEEIPPPTITWAALLLTRATISFQS